MEYLKLHMLPLVKIIDLGMVQDEIEEWESRLDWSIGRVEDMSERYAYTRKNAWRKNVPDGTAYGIDPRYYESEQAYLEALHECKYGWREWYTGDDTLGLDLNQFETEEEYLQAYDDQCRERRKAEQEQLWREERQEWGTARAGLAYRSRKGS